MSALLVTGALIYMLTSLPLNLELSIEYLRQEWWVLHLTVLDMTFWGLLMGLIEFSLSNITVIYHVNL